MNNWIWTLTTIVIFSFGAGAIFGAPWVPAFRKDLDELLDLAKVGEGTSFIDLGCGDGKILLRAAQRGATVTGYEINPILWAIAWLRLRPHRRRAHVRLGSYWGHDLQPYDIIWLYLIDHHMPRMARKIHLEAKPTAGILSYMFEFPGIKPAKTTYNSFLYTTKSFANTPISDKIDL